MAPNTRLSVHPGPSRALVCSSTAEYTISAILPTRARFASRLSSKGSRRYSNDGHCALNHTYLPQMTRTRDNGRGTPRGVQLDWWDEFKKGVARRHVCKMRATLRMRKPKNSHPLSIAVPDADEVAEISVANCVSLRNGVRTMLAPSSAPLILINHANPRWNHVYMNNPEVLLHFISSSSSSHPTREGARTFFYHITTGRFLLATYFDKTAVGIIAQ
ncbi:hypothetical protein B0H19DRAFT_1069314 [Mycena capillaripes]|nr:hypothetical protein B0H19DRAFT_1069314 [Mycena capillaripes]